MCDYTPRYQIPLGISDLPLKTQHKQVKLLKQLAHQDPRESLSCRLQIVRKILVAVEDRLQQQPEDAHQLFLREIHQQKEQQLLEALRIQNTGTRYQALDKWVTKKLKVLDPESLKKNTIDENPDVAEEKARLHREKGTWEKMVQRVREKLLKKPGDPKLMRLLGEHQGRLLHLQEQLRQQEQGYTDEPLVLESFETKQDNASEPITEKVRLEREIGVLTALCEKTRQRLFAKPELLHLKALIQHHEDRIKALNKDLNTLLNEDRSPTP